MADSVLALDPSNAVTLMSDSSAAMEPSSDPVASFVRNADRERWLAVHYAPAAIRPALLSIHALDLELAKIVATTTEPMLGEIRLAWWREQLEGLDRGQVPAQPVLQALAAEVLPRGVTGAALALFEDAWVARLDDDLATHVEARGRTVFGALAAVLGGQDAEALGRSWAAGEAARLGETVPSITTPRPPTALRSLAGMSALGRRDSAVFAAGLPPESRATPVRQLILLRAVMFGR